MACQIVTVRLKVKILTKRRHYNISVYTSSHNFNFLTIISM